MSELYDILVETPPTKVILLALDQGLWDCERSLNELAALCEANHMEAVAQIKKVLRRDCFFGGISVIFYDTKALVTQEMPLYLLFGGGACLLILFLALESVITPLLFMLGLLFPLVYNFGTNFFLKDVCFITEALAAVLQLGVTMDFSIFLLHRYEEEKELASSNEEAMVNAICKTLSLIHI